MLPLVERGQEKFCFGCPRSVTFHFLGRMLVGKKTLSVQPRAGTFYSLTAIIYLAINQSDYVDCLVTFKEKVYKIPKWFSMIANSLA